MLERCDGPECPRCGCQDSEILERPPSPTAASDAMSEAQKHYGRTSWFDRGRARCGFCGLVFHFSELPADLPPAEIPPPAIQSPPVVETPIPPPVDYQAPVIETPRSGNGAPKLRPIACPDCGSDSVRVTSTRATVRYYSCKACQYRFKMPRKDIQRVQES